MNAFEIQPLRAEHLGAAKSIIDSVGLFPSGMLDAMTAAFIAGTAPDELWFVAVKEAAPCAIAYCAPERMTDGTWNLLLIAVRTEHQGQGIAARLTMHLERTLAGRGGRMLLVETSGLPGFERTRTVYRRLGYREEARIRDFYAQGEDKVVFRKLLTATAEAAPAS